MKLNFKNLIILSLLLILCTACSPKMKVIEIKQNTKISINNKKVNNNSQIFKILENKTKFVRESIADSPLNVSSFNIISFITNNNETKIYAYKDNEKYYLEKPYVGVWEIDKDNFEKLVNMEE